jgi:purine-binding chemotaxis protein CheW
MHEAAIIKEEQTGIPEGENVHSTQYLTFQIAGESYAISVLQVKEILPFETITAVPSTPRSIRGVINLRGAVVPVVDLAVKFGLPESEITKWTCIVIVEADLAGEQTVMGVMTDAVSQVVEFQPGDIEAPPAFGTNVKTDYLVGMGSEEKKFVLILDIDAVLSAEELMMASLLAESEAEPSLAEPGESDEPSEEAEESEAPSGANDAKSRA